MLAIVISLAAALVPAAYLVARATNRISYNADGTFVARTTGYLDVAALGAIVLIAITVLRLNGVEVDRVGPLIAR